MSFENTLIVHDKNGTRLRIANGGTLQQEAGSLHLTTSGIGAIPVVTGLTGVERVGTMHRTILTLVAVPVATADHTTAGAQGTLALYTFPRGNILFVGGSTNLTITADGTGVTTGASVVGSVGTVAPGAGDATLTSTEANLIPSTAATLTLLAGVMKGRGVTQTFFDNTTTTASTQMTANLNFGIPDAGTTAAGVITVSGTIELVWVNLGDN